MNCTEAQRLLHAYIDNELDVAHTLEVERHLETCAVCLENYQEYQALRDAMRDDALYFTAPAKLQKSVQAALRERSRTPLLARATSWRGPGVAAAACLIAVALAVLLTGLWRTTSTVPPGGAGAGIQQQVFNNHMRSLMADHLVDIRSSNPDVIKPWFKGKLDYSPYIYNLAPAGYSLVGGRLDYLDNRAVAAIVYKYQGHIVNFFLWPSQQNSAPITISSAQGYHLANWEEEKMNCWAISDLKQSELQRFATLQRDWS
ncbi:anti-sigma factor family protein [Dictyobacter kobayashii]|uniref:Membrane protein n=1 Tax=Dictyobacter kobayashii TaxID=2014872 RepID=A0A402ARG4_9CHLR|nr:anti-sigma factor [Dictyobacter kobayashii]GCE21685.1 membrane protein [Dictyobacter kobayashii]